MISENILAFQKKLAIIIMMCVPLRSTENSKLKFFTHLSMVAQGFTGQNKNHLFLLGLKMTGGKYILR